MKKVKSKNKKEKGVGPGSAFVIALGVLAAYIAITRVADSLTPFINEEIHMVIMSLFQMLAITFMIISIYNQTTNNKRIQERWEEENERRTEENRLRDEENKRRDEESKRRAGEFDKRHNELMAQLNKEIAALKIEQSKLDTEILKTLKELRGDIKTD